MTPPFTNVTSFLGNLCPTAPESAAGELGCLAAEHGSLALAGGALLLAGFLGIRIRSRKRSEQEDRDGPLLVFPVRTGDRSRGAARAQTPVRHSAPRPEGAVKREATRNPTPEPTREPATTPTRERAPTSTREPAPTPTREPAPTPTRVEAGHVQFDAPPEGTLQLLPGRLEIESGEGAGHEVRFVRVPGTEPEVTLGRSSGEPHRHIRLDSPTVSRLHARLRFGMGRWTLKNESATNPTLHNGRALESPDDAATLRDGDRIELGDVVFRFRQPENRDRLPFRSSWFTDRGRRPTNQDAVAVRTLSDRRELAVVCDGMGAHAAGEIASHRALEALVSRLEAGDELVAAVRAANRAVREEAAGDPARDGMGTTLVALLRTGNHYEIANVGDSRAYRVDEDGIRQLSEDHSFVTEVVKAGRMSAEEAERSPWRNAVTRHLGADDGVEVDRHGTFSSEEPHLVVLCSDGAHSVLAPDDIVSVVRRAPSIGDVAREIGEGALRAGSDDNVTVVALRFGAGSEHPHHPDP